jgi:hypothetical protein
MVDTRESARLEGRVRGAIEPRGTADIPYTASRESTIPCCAAPSFPAASPEWVSEGHHSMSASATAFTVSSRCSPFRMQWEAAS